MDDDSKDVRELLYVPQVQLLLDKIYCQEEVKDLLIPIKSMMLYSQSMYKYTDISNFYSPGYFLNKIDDSCRWPGTTGNSQSDYKLSLNVWRSHDSKIFIEAMLKHATEREKIAWRKIYSGEKNKINIMVYSITRDLSVYFRLPLPVQKPQELNVTIFERMLNGETLNSLLIDGRDFTDIDFYMLSRELLLSEYSADDVSKWISKIREIKPIPSPELHVWLALLTYKAGLQERSLQMLNREYVAEFPDNALILMLKANLNLQQKNRDLYRKFYMRTMASLAAVHSPSEIIKHFKNVTISESCRKLWDGVLSEQGYYSTSLIVIENINEFCSAIDDM
nr:hypothetical protein [Vibrio vulnificus]